MEIDSKNQEKTGFISNLCGSFLAMLGKFKEKVVNVGKKAKKVGQDDPRKIIHSAKVGLALTIVSLFYYFRPLYDGFGQSGMWAIMTVVVVFEFTVGGTLSKCLNRGFATSLAGSLGIGADYLASICGEKGEPIVLGLLVFFIAAASTFIRFFPHIKQRYDYGVLIFILTFSLVTVSGYRVEQILELAHQRISTILIGAATCVIISVFLCPVWAGEGLHNLIASNMEKLASFLEGLGGENCSLVYQDDKLLAQDYRSVFNTKATEESLANFAWWEPGHGSFPFSHPWKQYLKIGVLIRECAYQFEALSGCRISETEAPKEIQSKISKPCRRMSSEAGKALKELSTAVKAMRHPSSSTIQTHLWNSKSAVDELRTILETLSLGKTDGIMEIIPAVAIASMLVELIKCIGKLSESVLELSKQANFEGSTAPENHELENDKHEKIRILRNGRVKIDNDDQSEQIVIDVRDTDDDPPSRKNNDISLK